MPSGRATASSPLRPVNAATAKASTPPPILRARASTAGLAALDYIAKGEAAPDSWKAQQTAAIAEIQKPKGQLLVVPAASLQKLIDAAAGGGSCSAH